MAADLQPDIDAITRAKGLEDSATTLISGIAARVQAAVDAAIGNGATEAQLQPVSDVVTALNASSDALATALAANP